MGNRYAMDRGYPKSVEKWVFKAILAIALQFGNSSNNAKKIGKLKQKIASIWLKHTTNLIFYNTKIEF